MRGILFDIQKFCTKDGPGIRTTVFFKGCPLRCLWCHNPESQKPCIEQMQKAKDEGYETCGREYTVEQVMEEVLKDRLFYENSGGGLTLSGGEPFLQWEFCRALMEAAKRQGLSIALETCGMAAPEIMQESAEFTDLYLYDFKESDAALHKELTGVSNQKILDNLKLLDKLGKEIILRCPIIPGYNDRKEHFAAIGALADSLEHLSMVQIEPYHSLGADKYRRLGRSYSLAKVENPQKEQVDGWIEEIRKHTKKQVERA